MSEEQTPKQLKTIVLGGESLENLRLANILRKILGQENVHRYLEPKHFLKDVEDMVEHPIVTFVDLFSLNLKTVTDTIGFIRSNFPIIAFCLYVEKNEVRDRQYDIPGEWALRLQHYHKLFKVSEDVEFEPLVRRILHNPRSLAQAGINYQQAQFQQKTKIQSHASQNATSAKNEKLFISYSRTDWESFVQPLVSDLKNAKYTVWLDQDLLVGGDDWMDAIGEALDTCKLLILVASPEALESRYVKMEYRYFFNYGKTIIPVLYRLVKRFPPELSTIQYVDCSGSNQAAGFKELKNILKRHLQQS